MADRTLTQITPVILSGGAGSRLWPLSRTRYPKQFLPLAGPMPMIQETAQRVTGLRFAAPLVICNEEHRFIVAEQLRHHAPGPIQIILEPCGRNTAPAVTVAALHLLTQLGANKKTDPLMLVMPSDHVIGDVGAFMDAVDKAATAAGAGALATFGITANRPETGYGYIKQAAPLAGQAGVYAVERFVEKPDPVTAQRYVDDGGYHWNSGIFVFSARSWLREIERTQPAILTACRQALTAGQRDLTFLRLDADRFSTCPSDSIDYAVMEKTTHAVVVPVDMGWSDLGAWSALWDIGPRDADDNVVRGDVLLHQVSDSFVRSDHRLVAVAGLKNVVVVATDDAVLVASRDKAQDVKAIVDQLKAAGRTEHDLHTTVHRPWGSYRGIDHGERFQVKHILVNPGERLSLQMHHHRAEHWVVVSGTAKVTRGTEQFLLSENQSTYIPAGEVHRLENPGKVPLHLIEVQSGGYLGEDDIVRLEDSYARH